MYILYLDHAGAIEDPGQQHFVLAGISVFERQTYWLAQELEKIGARFNPADPFSVELHGSPMHGGRSGWRRFPVADRIRALSDALAVIAKSHVSNTLFATAVKKPKNDPASAVALAFEQVCGMFDRSLLRRHRQGSTHRGIIVFDKATYESDIQSLATDFRTVGHQTGIIKNLSEVPLFLDSKASRLVQLADLIAFACYRFYESKDSRFVDIVKDRFDGGGGVSNLKYFNPDVHGTTPTEPEHAVARSHKNQPSPKRPRA